MLAASFPVLGLALALEGLVGDPVTRWHPVALFGRGVALLLRVAPGVGPARQVAFSAALVGGSVGLIGLGSAAALALLSDFSPLGNVLLGAILLKVSFSYRQLRSEALGVARVLREENLAAARDRLSALVSRDTVGLDTGRAASAAIESLAENLCDSVVAPFFYYVLLGVPGALAYRAINTLDAMIGYHGRYEYLGKVAARTDDLANWVPARVTAALMVLASWLGEAGAVSAARGALSDHARTESPNAGWPIAAMAGAIGVTLEKPEHYLIGRGPAPSPADVARAVRVADRAFGLAAAALVGIALA